MKRSEMRRRMAQHPKAVSLDEARRMLEAYGWTVLRTSRSHYLFALGGTRLVIPYRRPHILAAYVRQVVQATEGADDDDSDHDDA